MKKKKYPIYALQDPESYGMTEKEVLNLWQEGVDSGVVWRLQGWYGRNADHLLEQGVIHYPKKHSGSSGTDYYGNKIPTDKQHKELKKKLKKLGVKS